jgi:transposase
MATMRTSVQMHEHITQLAARGYSIRAIAAALRVSRNTVRKILGRTPEIPPPELAAWIQAVSWEYVREEVYGKGTTIKQIHQEVAPTVSYVKFWRAFRAQVPQRASPTDVTLRLHHKPGEKVQVDFCDGIPIHDPTTGKVTSTQLFCGVLPFSSYTFGEFVLNQKLPTFLGVQERMFAFFGGVTRYAVPDNLKSGVQRAHLYDPDANPTYCDFAQHMGFAVLPARPYKARDKAATESAIGVIQRGFFQEVRQRTFYSLTELNQAFRAYLARLNHTVMKDYGVSRAQRFAEERRALQPLPTSRYQVREWRWATVHPDCHIQVDKNFYSVPFVYVGQRVRVRLSEKLIDVFTEESQSIAAHVRLVGLGKFATLEAHYPDAKMSVARFDVRHAREQAKKLGPHVQQLVNHLLSGEYPLRYLRRVQGILRLPRSHSLTPDAVDYACERALNFNKPRLAYIKDCAVYFATHGRQPRIVAPTRSPDTVHLHHPDAAASPRTAEEIRLSTRGAGP